MFAEKSTSVNTSLKHMQNLNQDKQKRLKSDSQYCYQASRISYHSWKAAKPIYAWVDYRKSTAAFKMAIPFKDKEETFSDRDLIADKKVSKKKPKMHWQNYKISSFVHTWILKRSCQELSNSERILYLKNRTSEHRWYAEK